MRQAINAVRTDIAQGQEEMAEFREQVVEEVGKRSETRLDEAAKELRARAGEGSRVRDGGLKVSCLFVSYCFRR